MTTCFICNGRCSAYYSKFNSHNICSYEYSSEIVILLNNCYKDKATTGGFCWEPVQYHYPTPFEQAFTKLPTQLLFDVMTNPDLQCHSTPYEKLLEAKRYDVLSLAITDKGRLLDEMALESLRELNVSTYTMLKPFVDIKWMISSWHPRYFTTGFVIVAGDASRSIDQDLLLKIIDKFGLEEIRVPTIPTPDADRDNDQNYAHLFDTHPEIGILFGFDKNWRQTRPRRYTIAEYHYMQRKLVLYTERIMCENLS